MTAWVVRDQRDQLAMLRSEVAAKAYVLGYLDAVYETHVDTDLRIEAVEVDADTAEWTAPDV